MFMPLVSRPQNCFGIHDAYKIRDGAHGRGAGARISGVIAAIDRGVQDFELGDEVYGMNDWFGDGATAEFCITLPQNIARKPLTLSHEAAADYPIAAVETQGTQHPESQLHTSPDATPSCLLAESASKKVVPDMTP
jgi:hypothetical protein